MSALHYSRLILALPLFFLCGCCSDLTPEKTADYYHPSTATKFPPKPKDYQIPILTVAPSRKYQVIGRFTMTQRFYHVEDGYVFMNCAAEFNARNAGADAILIVERWQDHTHHYYETTETGDSGADCSNNVANVEPETRASIFYDAKMIVYK